MPGSTTAYSRSWPMTPLRFGSMAQRWWTMIQAATPHAKLTSRTVTSSRLCKNAEGAVFPFQVETLEDGVDDSVHGFDVDEADHGPRSSPDFDETALDDIGGTQLAPQVLGEAEEGQQLRQIAL